MDTGKLAQNLKQLHLKEIYNSKFRADTAPNSWFRGKEQIDGVWVTNHISNFNVSITPYFFGVGDHKSIIFNIPSDQLLSKTIFSICKPDLRKLNLSNISAVEKYLALL